MAPGSDHWFQNGEVEWITQQSDVSKGFVWPHDLKD